MDTTVLRTFIVVSLRISFVAASLAEMARQVHEKLSGTREEVALDENG
jgi:hypothetical protein